MGTRVPGRVTAAPSCHPSRILDDTGIVGTRPDHPSRPPLAALEPLEACSSRCAPPLDPSMLGSPRALLQPLKQWWRTQLASRRTLAPPPLAALSRRLSTALASLAGRPSGAIPTAAAAVAAAAADDAPAKRGRGRPRKDAAGLATAAGAAAAPGAAAPAAATAAVAAAVATAAEHGAAANGVAAAAAAVTPKKKKGGRGPLEPSQLVLENQAALTYKAQACGTAPLALRLPALYHHGGLECFVVCCRRGAAVPGAWTRCRRDVDHPCGLLAPASVHPLTCRCPPHTTALHRSASRSCWGGCTPTRPSPWTTAHTSSCSARCCCRRRCGGRAGGLGAGGRRARACARCCSEPPGEPAAAPAAGCLAAPTACRWHAARAPH